MLPDRIGSAKRISDITVYDRETIFDYLDGAGEVYNSYAFKEVAVAHYLQEGRPEIVLELFDMGTSEDAYGVFSYSREDEEIGIGGGYELRGSVLCFWQDCFYVCLTFEQPDSADRELLVTTARNISAVLPVDSTRPQLVDLLPSDGLIPHSDRYFHRNHSLNYHYYLARQNVLQLDSTTNAVLARYQPGSTLLLLVEYPDAERASLAADTFGQDILSGAKGVEPVALANGKYTSCSQVERCLIIVLEAPSSQVALSLGKSAQTRVAKYLSRGR